MASYATRADALTKKPIDASSSTVAEGPAIGEWRQADAADLLMGIYLDSEIYPGANYARSCWHSADGQR